MIARRTSSGFLTRNLAEMYEELSAHCGIPKTCFALLKSIETNPDSPYVDNSFYLKSKTRYFYENYVLRIEKIIVAMNVPEVKNKFLAAYRNRCTKYKADAGIT